MRRPVTPRRIVFVWLFAAAGLLLLPACAGPGETAREAPGAQGPDAARVVQGIRIQIHTTSERAEAETRLEEALMWWQDVPPAERPPRPPRMQGDALNVDIAWKQPYYRVRLGAFAERAGAERTLQLVRQRFPDAFIIPATVTLAR